MSPHTIRQLDVWALECGLQQPFGFSQWYYAGKTNTLVRITTESGLTGWGECYGPAKPVASAIRDYFANRVVGMDALAHEEIWNKLHKSSLDFSRKGIFMAAISGIDMALWDLKGQVTGLPVWKLMGGRSGDLPCYATGMYFRPGVPEDRLIQELLEEADGYAGDGFTALKIKIGKNPAFDEKLIAAFRKRYPSMILAADSNHAYSFKEALRIGKLLSDLDYRWFEEPLSPDDLQGYAKLRSMVTVPISTGECEQTRWGFHELLKSGGVDMIQPDIAYCGGLTEFQKLVGLASAHHVDLVPHCWGLRVNQAAAAAAISVLPENPGRFEPRPVLLEMDMTEHPIRDGVFTEWNEIKSGSLRLSDKPGLGVRVDEKALARFASPVP